MSHNTRQIINTINIRCTHDIWVCYNFVCRFRFSFLFVFIGERLCFVLVPRGRDAGRLLFAVFEPDFDPTYNTSRDCSLVSLRLVHGVSSVPLRIRFGRIMVICLILCERLAADGREPSKELLRTYAISVTIYGWSVDLRSTRVNNVW